jgi:hypothetical protein
MLKNSFFENSPSGGGMRFLGRVTGWGFDGIIVGIDDETDDAFPFRMITRKAKTRTKAKATAKAAAGSLRE